MPSSSRSRRSPPGPTCRSGSRRSERRRALRASLPPRPSRRGSPTGRSRRRRRTPSPGGRASPRSARRSSGGGSPPSAKPRSSAPGTRRSGRRRGERAPAGRSGALPRLPPAPESPPGRARRGPGAPLVRYLLLLPSRRLLPAAARARRLRGGGPEPSLLPLPRDPRRNPRHEPPLLRHRRPLPPTQVPPRGLPLLRGEPRGALPPPRLPLREDGHLGGTRLLRLVERLQHVRRVGLLGVHGRPLPERAGEAPLLLHRGRGDSRSDRRVFLRRRAGRSRRSDALPPLRGRDARDLRPVHPSARPPLRPRTGGGRSRAGGERSLRRESRPFRGRRSPLRDPALR